MPPHRLDVPWYQQLDKASEKLIRTMEQFEERVADHVKKYVSLVLDSDGQRMRALEQTESPKVALDDVNLEASVNAEEVTWASVIGRRKRHKTGYRGGERGERYKLRPDATPGVRSNRGNERKRIPDGLGMMPSTAAVCVRSAGGGVTAADLLRMAKEKIVVVDTDVKSMKVRESVVGGLVIEFSGEDCVKRADGMADSLRAAMIGESVSVFRPIRLAAFRLRGLDLAVDQGEVRRAVSAAGGCLEADITVGEIGRLPGGTRSVWVRCPSVVARNLHAVGRLAIGWSSAVVEYLRVQRTQCYKCWRFGHLRETCQYIEDRSNSCFKCGLPGHCAKDCKNALRCVLCQANDLDPAHRMGSTLCGSTRVPRLS